jgi:O-methyltransferase involved in polyketide biosynthesis
MNVTTAGDKLPAEFTGVRATALLELYLRKLDSESRHPILGDATAGPAVDRIDIDFTQFSTMDVARFAVGVRSSLMDQWIRDFVADRPDAIVLDLGSGLDSRALRIGLGPLQSWYDIDFPDVSALAAKLYPPESGRHLIGASVTDAEWLRSLPTDRPAMLVADGLLNFLSKDEVRATLAQLVDHLLGGELVFNITSSVVEHQRARHPVKLFQQLGIVEKWFLDSPEALTELEPRLRHVETRGLMDKALLARTPLYYRAMGALVRAVPAWNNSGWILRYRF